MKRKLLLACLVLGTWMLAAAVSAQVKPAAVQTFPRFVDLNGEWDFTYERDFTYESTPRRSEDGPGQIPVVPADKSFVAKMPVPGYWDDHLDLLRSTAFWHTARFNPGYRRLEFPLGTNPPDASLLYLLGVGWYRKTFEAPPNCSSCLATLRVGGVRLEAWVWLNGKLMGHHRGHSTPFEVRLEAALKPGTRNTLTIAVANVREEEKATELWYLGSAAQGYQGRSAGIYRPVSIKMTGDAAIRSCYLRPAGNANRILWLLELEGRDAAPDAVIQWAIRDAENRSILGNGTVPVRQASISWETPAFQMRPWSDHDPNLYTVEVSVKRGGLVLDRHEQTFGWRLLERDGTQLRLNGQPVMLRGCTDHYYFPLTTTAPEDVSFYRQRIRQLKQLGFNWIRFHTWVPSEAQMTAADQLGMMLQVEGPRGFGVEEWTQIVKTCRTHPSVVFYCPGNEEMLDDEKIGFLQKLAALVREHAPDALFNPQEAMKGVEYQLTAGSKDVLLDPFPHNPQRLARLRTFSDVFGAYLQGRVSYSSVRGDWREFDRWLAIYQRPVLTHELGIHGNYLNLDLEHRYEGTRIGTDLFASTRRNLAKAGLLSRAALYYRNSCAWMRILRKHAVEMARKSKYIAGYDLLGAFDQNWHRSGYPSGIMNEFFELKPEESVSDVRRYNGESVLLLDHSNRRNFAAGERMRLDVLASLYGRSPLREGVLRWRVVSGSNIYGRGAWPVHHLRNGAIHPLGPIDCELPQVTKPAQLTLFVQLEGDDYLIANDWDFWMFPPAGTRHVRASADAAVMRQIGFRYPGLQSAKLPESGGLRIVSAVEADTIEHLNNGGDVLLLGHAPFPALPTSFQMSMTGRAAGDLATVIEDHPLLRRFPHDGYCDWQFYSLLEGGRAINFNDLMVPFDPILEVVSSFKLIYKQAAIFEWRVGNGRLLVCSMNLDLTDPAAGYLLDSMIDYMQGDEFKPRTPVDRGTLSALLERQATNTSAGR